MARDDILKLDRFQVHPNGKSRLISVLLEPYPMNPKLSVALLAVTLVMVSLTGVRADEVNLTLVNFKGCGSFTPSTWDLYAEVIDTEGGADGRFGLASVRALIDGIDFGNNGEAVVIAAGIGVLDPIDPGGDNERPPVLQTIGGTI